MKVSLKINPRSQPRTIRQAALRTSVVLQLGASCAAIDSAGIRPASHIRGTQRPPRASLQAASPPHASLQASSPLLTADGHPSPHLELHLPRPPSCIEAQPKLYSGEGDYMKNYCHLSDYMHASGMLSGHREHGWLVGRGS
mmetsp:Transcript_37893/g.51914  ORF Transcript_37893/g.51914 Transcript_37893/m.51914 type:complete len:141 (-) Transcript_37893:48-470(-)